MRINTWSEVNFWNINLILSAPFLELLSQTWLKVYLTWCLHVTRCPQGPTISSPDIRLGTGDSFESQDNLKSEEWGVIITCLVRRGASWDQAVQDKITETQDQVNTRQCIIKSDSGTGHLLNNECRGRCRWHHYYTDSVWSVDWILALLRKSGVASFPCDVGAECDCDC